MQASAGHQPRPGGTDIRKGEVLGHKSSKEIVVPGQAEGLQKPVFVKSEPQDRHHQSRLRL